MKSYIDNLERLGHPMSLGIAVRLILTSLSKEYDGFIQKYNMHGMGKTVNDLHAMLKLHEKRLPKKDVTLVGLRGSKKLKVGALNLYVGNENRSTVEAIGSFDLVLPNGSCIVLDNLSSHKKQVGVLYEVIQEDTHPSENTSQLLDMVEHESVEPQSEVIPIRRSTRTHYAPNQMCLYVEPKEHALRDHNEPANYNIALSDPEPDKWHKVINA
ncbi:hypothetical protein Tco_0308070 [Tanacetum coccineum]